MTTDIRKQAMTMPRLDTHAHLGDGIMDEKRSSRFLEHCYQETPKRVFGL